MKNCIFCQIVSSQAPSYKLGENESAIAILNLYPFSTAHTLIIAKKHCPRFSDLPEKIAQEMASLAAVLARKIRDEYGVSDLNYLVNEGLIAGQTIFHAHLHVIPKKTNSNSENGLIQKSNTLHSPSDNELLAMQKKLAF